MSALVVELEIEQGADFQREFTITDLNNTELPNFANFGIEGQMRDAYFKLIFDLDITITSSKTILVWIKSEATELLSNFKQGHYKFDIFGLSPTGIRYKFVDATVTSKQEQTKPQVV